jgi:hypothetical protein
MFDAADFEFTGLADLLDQLPIEMIASYLLERADNERDPVTQSYAMETPTGEALICLAFTPERASLIKAAVASEHPAKQNPIEHGLRQQLARVQARVQELEAYITTAAVVTTKKGRSTIDA